MKKETVYVAPRMASVCVDATSMLCLSGPYAVFEDGENDEEEVMN